MADQRGYRGANLVGPQAAVPHTPVLLRTTVELLNVRPGGRFVDATLGTGGHAEAILQLCSPGGSLLGIDADPKALDVARLRLSPHGQAVTLVNDNFRYLEAICRAHDFYPADGILLDLGMSSLQLDDKDRGFSFRYDAPLDMRFGPDQSTTAAKILNSFAEKDIAALLRDYGEERHSRLIARRIVAIRPIETTMQLVNAIEHLPGMTPGRIHPATRTFQALRIAVNREMENLEEVLSQTVRVLAKGGRLAVISYHSLEDRLVKHFMQAESKTCLCPPEVPVCTCGHTPTLRLVNRKAIAPSEEEMRDNPRSRSAKLRVAERT
ncbi:MAG TPA: 16S rRNA (cytosine(1402)-N(4))-methyltransferase RsmH [Dehalococcoidia bacterium]|nr:16S rRNA (cytosine(1402)-N(4))-methyltransferase RsmH [Dehalococcoidia bacterium]